METLYFNKYSARSLCLLRFLVGFLFIGYVLLLIFNGNYLETFTIAESSPIQSRQGVHLIFLPMFGLALTINGLTSSRVRAIAHDKARNTIVITKISLFREKVISIPMTSFSVDLRSKNGKKGFLPQLRLVLIDGIQDVEEIKNGTFTINRKKIKLLYNQLGELNPKQ